MSDTLPSESTLRSTGPIQDNADLLERLANGVLFFAVLTGVGSIIGGLVALTNSEGDDGHPFIALGFSWIVGGGLLSVTVAMLAIWAKTYAAVVRHDPK